MGAMKSIDTARKEQAIKTRALNKQRKINQECFKWKAGWLVDTLEGIAYMQAAMPAVESWSSGTAEILQGIIENAMSQATDAARQLAFDMDNN